MTQQTPDPRQGREGSRWFNQRPAPDEFGEWFKTIKLHDGLDHADFISGLTLIQQTEKTNEVIGFDQHGLPSIREVKNLVYIPYAKVDARVDYFWKYMALNPEWLGVIEPVTWPGQLATNFNLPPGYFRMIQKLGDKETTYVGCSMRVRIIEAATAQEIDVTETGPDGKVWRRRHVTGKPVKVFSPGTKISATTGKYEPDHFSLMKAETGAVGRALGMAGMLVIPGSGVATAEDMQEAQSPVGAATPGAAALPTEVATDVADQENDPAFLRQRIGVLLTALGEDAPEALKQFQGWARERGFTRIEDLTDVQVKGVVKKLERTLDDAMRAVAADAPGLVAAEE